MLDQSGEHRCTKKVLKEQKQTNKNHPKLTNMGGGGGYITILVPHRKRQTPYSMSYRAPSQAHCAGVTFYDFPPPQMLVLTSVCALGSPALAFSRTSSKGISTSAFTGP